MAAITLREDPDKAEVEGIPLVLGVENITLAATAGIRVALIADEHGIEDGAMVDKLQQYFRQVILLRGELDIPVERVEVRNLGGVFGLEFVNQLLRRRNRAVKRSMDIGLGSILLLTSLPVIAVSALLVKLSSRGPAFYAQQREGLAGGLITVRKLRTMYTDSDERLRVYLQSDPAAREEWRRLFKLKDDPRVVPGIGPSSASLQYRRASPAVERGDRRDEPGGTSTLSLLPSRGVWRPVQRTTPAGAARSHRSVAGNDPWRGRYSGTGKLRYILHTQLVVVDGLLSPDPYAGSCDSGSRAATQKMSLGQ